jgi:hypothetical protein
MVATLNGGKVIVVFARHFAIVPAATGAIASLCLPL